VTLGKVQQKITATLKLGFPQSLLCGTLGGSNIVILQNEHARFVYNEISSDAVRVKRQGKSLPEE